MNGTSFNDLERPLSQFSRSADTQLGSAISLDVVPTTTTSSPRDISPWTSQRQEFPTSGTDCHMSNVVNADLSASADRVVACGLSHREFATGNE